MNLQDKLAAFEQKLQDRAEIHKEAHWIKRSLWAAGGFLLLGAGLAMLVLPGPGLLVIAIGLGILALEFAWADWLLRRGIRSGMRVGQLITLRRLVLLLLGVALLGAVLLVVLL